MRSRLGIQNPEKKQDMPQELPKSYIRGTSVIPRLSHSRGLQWYTTMEDKHSVQRYYTGRP
ncbi:unnamed protein product [Penicillium camemberti]|uniref:Str. FM013 n=1 Tax=Penicillium camemberti (strain FM 013) TaxID=1429867 RepID=A0A0G4P5S6_PENC3|nr:unnamed protein product [Penicillium camemberti]